MGVQGIEKDIGCFGNDGARNLQQKRLLLPKPFRADLSGRREARRPVLRQVLQPDDRDLYVGTFDFQERELRWNVIRAGVNADLQQRCRWTSGQINDGLARFMPAPRATETTQSTEIAMPADPPEDHSDKHAFVDLNEEFFDDAAAGIRMQKGKW